ncbi:MAG: recombinase family protein [Candidatus Riflebacteria bacterium]|nr:recombinase family protein [Candidatus Riflebacteria bacterium]
MYLNGYGYGKLIDYLNAQGHSTKWKKLFGKTAIHNIPRNKKYTGLYTFNKAPSILFLIIQIWFPSRTIEKSSDFNALITFAKGGIDR